MKNRQKHGNPSLLAAQQKPFLMVKNRAEHLNLIGLLADTLQGLESSSRRVDPEHYSVAVSNLADQLALVTMDRDLRNLLSCYPAAGELYENLHYDSSGLSLHNNEQAMQAERQVQHLIGSIRAKTT